jgi:DNA invertase Pin-like site-specific DNA recombinase
VRCGQAAPGSKATEPPIDPGTAAGKVLMFASLRPRASAQGIVRPKAAGVYKGRPASIDAAQVRATKAEGKGASEIAKAFKIGRASVYRVLEAG